MTAVTERLTAALPQAFNAADTSMPACGRRLVKADTLRARLAKVKALDHRVRTAVASGIPN